MNQNRAFSWKKKKVITGRENFLVKRKKFVRYSYLPEKDCWGRLVKGSWSKRRLRQHQYFGWSHDQIFHHWATRHSNVPGLWKVCFLFMKWVRRICGRGWRTSTLMWAWDLPDRCLRQKNFRREFPWRLRIWNLIPLTHQCLNTLESADIMLWGTHALIYFYFIKKIYWCTVDWPTYQFRRHKRWGFSSWVGKIPWRRKWQPPPVCLPGESPWTEEPGGLQSTGPQRVWHDPATEDTHIHGWLTMLCYFQVYNKVVHSYVSMCPFFSPKFPSWLDCNIILSRVPCAIQ